MRGRCLALFVVLVCLSGCNSTRPTREPAILLRPDEIPRDCFIRQKVSGTFEDKTASFEAVLQKKGDTFTVLGLTPMGTRAFVLRQKGTIARLESYMPKGRELPLHPRFLLQDIHHAFFLALPDPSEKGGAERRGILGDERVVERHVEGKVVEREFEAVSGDPPGTVRVTYEGGMEGPTPPRITHLDNGYYGYSIQIETLSHEWLE